MTVKFGHKTRVLTLVSRPEGEYNLAPGELDPLRITYHNLLQAVVANNIQEAADLAMDGLRFLGAWNANLHTEALRCAAFDMVEHLEKITEGNP